MRVKIVNKSAWSDAEIVPLIEYAATFFPHRTGVVRVIVKSRRNNWYARGVCWDGRECTIWVSKPGEDRGTYPCEFNQMHYFRHARRDRVKTLVAADQKEYMLALIAHEMEHTTKGNRKMRRSRQEIHAWNRGVEVVEASRTPEGQTWLKARADEIVRAAQHRLDRKAFAKSAEAKRENVEKLMIKWRRKLKLAQTKIRKLKVRAKYFDKKIAASGSPKEGK